MKCTRCKCELQKDEPVTTNGLCCSCHDDTVDPDACISCGERKRVGGSLCCPECAPLEEI
jgi:hypothetical protein